VVADAESKIKSKLGKEEHEQLIDKYLTKVVPS
jgi:F0F1-type ATP synthase membrane subunit b/b'